MKKRPRTHTTGSTSSTPKIASNKKRATRAKRTVKPVNCNEDILSDSTDTELELLVPYRSLKFKESLKKQQEKELHVKKSASPVTTPRKASPLTTAKKTATTKKAQTTKKPSPLKSVRRLSSTSTPGSPTKSLVTSPLGSPRRRSFGTPSRTSPRSGLPGGKNIRTRSVVKSAAALRGRAVKVVKAKNEKVVSKQSKCDIKGKKLVTAKKRINAKSLKSDSDFVKNLQKESEIPFVKVQRVEFPLNKNVAQVKPTVTKGDTNPTVKPEGPKDNESVDVDVKNANICDSDINITAEKVKNEKLVKEESKTVESVETIETVVKEDTSEDKELTSSVKSVEIKSVSKETVSEQSDKDMASVEFRKLKTFPSAQTEDLPKATINAQDSENGTNMNVNVSLTDQVKINQIKKDSWNNNNVNTNNSDSSPMSEGLGSRTAAVPAQISAHGSSSTEPKTRAPPLSNHNTDNRSSGNYGDMKVGHSDNRPVNVVAPTTATNHSTPRTNNSNTHSPNKIKEERCSSAEVKMVEEHRKSVSSSPLVLDSKEPVKVYRDPELLRKDEILLQQAAASRPTPSTTSALPSAQSIPAGLSSLYNGAPIGAGHLGMPPHLTTAAAMTNLYTQQQMMHAQLLAGTNYAAAAAVMAGQAQTNKLEQLWHQKFPHLQMPPGWMLGQYQDDLLRNSTMMNEQVMERERAMALARKDMADRERLEQERIDR